jgi:serine/threonine-protein kinase SRPK3
MLTVFRENRWVSLKILKADTSKGSKELQNIRRISQLTQGRAGPWPLCKLLDHFVHPGPNGKHLCLIQALLGPNLKTVLDYINYDQDDREYLSPRTVLKISKQLLQAVASLHSVRISHGGTPASPANFILV